MAKIAEGGVRVMRRFNTAGPCLPDYHYTIPPLRRLPEAHLG